MRNKRPAGSPESRGADNGVRSGLRVLLYIGRFRPEVTPDSAHELLARVAGRGYKIAGAIVSRHDSIIPTLKGMKIPVLEVHHFIDQPLAKVTALLKKSASERRHLVSWLSRVAEWKPDIGVVFYGNWLPPGLFRLPSLGFLNYHPAPLPKLRGVEPDTFCILEGMKEVWGTVHLVSEGYDEGPIIERSGRLKLTRYTTPVVVWHKLTEFGIRAIVRALDKVRRGNVRLEKQDHRQASDASRARAHRESMIQWKTDDLDMLHRRLLTYCGQDIRIRLKAEVDGRLYCVRDLELYSCSCAGRPGDLLGSYSGSGPFRGQPLIKVIGGVAVVRLGVEIRPGAKKDPYEPLALLIPPRRRSRTTVKRIVLADVRRGR